MKALEEKTTALKQNNESLLITVKQQEDRITEIATDSSHWERKSVSLSKELGEDINKRGLRLYPHRCVCSTKFQILTLNPLSPTQDPNTPVLTLTPSP
jgi:hypothetical protein